MEVPRYSPSLFTNSISCDSYSPTTFDLAKDSADRPTLRVSEITGQTLDVRLVVCLLWSERPLSNVIQNNSLISSTCNVWIDGMGSRLSASYVLYDIDMLQVLIDGDSTNRVNPTAMNGMDFRSINVTRATTLKGLYRAL
jgi:hypothetical protein